MKLEPPHTSRQPRTIAVINGNSQKNWLQWCCNEKNNKAAGFHSTPTESPIDSIVFSKAKREGPSELLQDENPRGQGEGVTSEKLCPSNMLREAKWGKDSRNCFNIFKEYLSIYEQMRLMGQMVDWHLLLVVCVGEWALLYIILHF